MKVSELQGAELDYWAGKADEAIGLALNEDYCYYRKDENSRIEIYSPSTDWAQGGPIIERERIESYPYLEDECEQYWRAAILLPNARPKYFSAQTPLQAAMRCLVASRYGDEVPTRVHPNRTF